MVCVAKSFPRLIVCYKTQTMSRSDYDWGKDDKQNEFKRRDPLDQLREEQEARKSRVDTSQASVNPKSTSFATPEEKVPQRVNLDDPYGAPKNQFPGDFRYLRMPDDTFVDVMETPHGIGKWEQILYYMYKRPLVPITIVGMLGSFSASIVSLITKQPSKTTHFWANMIVGFQVCLIHSQLIFFLGRINRISCGICILSTQI
jgi:hypothetical protein